MADACILKSGEIVLLDDPRLSDPACSIEPGVIIRPPVDSSVVDDQKPEQKKPRSKTQMKKADVKPEPKVEVKAEALQTTAKQPVVKTKTKSHVEVPSDAPLKKETSFELTPEAAMIAAGVTVAVAGGAVATSAAGGLSAVQAKIASLFGSKGAVAGAAAVTAGTIVAVKALESKMGKLEKDMKKAKEDVRGAASSIDRIDELLSQLGGNNDDKLDPPV